MQLNTDRMAEKLIIVIILGLASSVTSHISRLSDNMETMTASVIKLNSRLELIASDLGLAHDELKDHESRLRGLEKK